MEEVKRLMDERGLTFEAYTLVLKHSIWNKGEEHELEEPIAVRCMYDKTFGNPTYVINEMMDKMKHELLLRCAKNRGTINVD